MPISSLFLLPKTAALEKVQLMKRLLSQLHWILTTAFLLALFPLFRRAALPLSIDLREIGGAYWLGTGVKAVFCAVVLYVLCFPWAATGAPAVRRIWENKVLLAGAIAIFPFLILLFVDFLPIQIILYGVSFLGTLLRIQKRFAPRPPHLLIPP